MKETRNAIIESTFFGTEDHGIFTAWLTLSYGGSGQGFGGYRLDGPIQQNGRLKGRVGTAYGMQFVMEILRVLGVESWEKLKGTHCRVEADQGKVYRIGNILKDEWFDPDELLRKCKEAA